MTREGSVVRALVQVADTLVSDFDLVDMLAALTDQLVELLDVTAVGVMVASSSGELGVVASSSDEMRVVEVFELQAREGPCMDCYHTGEQVAHEDLAAPDNPWPRFARIALQAGFRSAHALPLRLRGTTVGALNLFHATAMPMSADDIIVAQAFADLAAISILQARAATDAKALNEQLNTALTSRIVIEQAKGVLAERSGLDVGDAFEELRRYARSHNLGLTAVAQAVVAGTISDDALQGRRPAGAADQ